MKKTNRTFKRFAAITSASLLAACAVMPAVSSAADITITGSAGSPYVADQATHTYEAYQIFAGTLSGTTLSDIQWGTGISVNATTNVPERTYTENGTAKTVNIYDELKALDLGSIGNPFKKTVEQQEVALESAEEVANALTGLDDNHKIAKEFANTVAKYLSTNPDNKKTSDQNNTISDLANGYYLVQDSEDSIENKTDSAKTRYILKVAGEDIQVQTKSSYPTVMKKVQEESLKGGENESVSFGGSDNYNPGDGYNDVADYDIGDNVPFKLYGTLPSGIVDYDRYYYCFRDTLGTQFDRPDNITIKIKNTASDVFLYYKWDSDANDYVQCNNEGTKVTEGIDTNCNVTFANGAFAVAFKDILSYNGVSADTEVTVSYTARLNESANVGYDGQVNGVYLEYSNNPNEEYNGDYNGTTEDINDKPDTSNTTEDGVIVFTYGFDINKVIKDTTTKLADAYFAVYYETEGAGGETIKNYIKTDNDNCFDGLLTGRPSGTTVGGETTYTASNAAGIWKSEGPNGGNITILGLDKDKTYYIEELKAPATYNALKEPVAVTIASTLGNAIIYQQGWTYTLDANTGKGAMNNISISYSGQEVGASENLLSTTNDYATVTIGNSQGSTLPGTGGIGTTIFYLGGGAMAAIGGVYLISKRRMKKSEE